MPITSLRNMYCKFVIMLCTNVNPSSKVKLDLRWRQSQINEPQSPLCVGYLRSQTQAFTPFVP